MKPIFFFEPKLTYYILSQDCWIWAASDLSLNFFSPLKIVFLGSKVAPFRAQPKQPCHVTMT